MLFWVLHRAFLSLKVTTIIVGGIESLLKVALEILGCLIGYNALLKFIFYAIAILLAVSSFPLSTPII